MNHTDNLLKSQMKLEERLFVKNLGPHQPRDFCMRQEDKSATRRFCVQCFDKKPWLTASFEKNLCFVFTVYFWGMKAHGQRLTRRSPSDPTGNKGPLTSHNHDLECDRTKCDWKRYQHYLAQDCQPIYDGGSCCPTQFSCKSEYQRGLRVDRCNYRGKSYGNGESIPIEHSCSAACMCTATSRDRPASVTCANVECPSLFRRGNPNCRPLYTQGRCCSTGEECGVSNLTKKCVWKGQTWKLGDRMDIDDFPCQSCVCTDDFTHPNGPGCNKVDCGFEFRDREEMLKGCTPLYFEDKCCPIPEWICPDDIRIIGQIRPTDVAHPGECKLGSFNSIPVGGSLRISDCKIECFCKTPPALTCVQHRSCDRLRESLALREAKECPPVDCPVNCNTVTEPFTGCPKCLCSTDFACPNISCPHGCPNPSISFDEAIGCKVCKCEI